jgi:HPt (histidine-containing phosphotransfer) domain-containing protein
LDSTRERLARAGGADRASLQRIAHDLVGTSGTFGALRLSLVARQVEHAAMAQDEDVGAAVAVLQRVGEDSIAAVAQRWNLGRDQEPVRT